MNTLYDYSKNAYNLNITSTKDTSNRDEIIIVLCDFTEKWR